MLKYLMRQNLGELSQVPWRNPGISSQLPFLSRCVILSKRQDVYLTRFIFLGTLLTLINCSLPSNSLLIEVWVNHCVLLGIQIRLSGLLFPESSL